MSTWTVEQVILKKDIRKIHLLSALAGNEKLRLVWLSGRLEKKKKRAMKKSNEQAKKSKEQLAFLESTKWCERRKHKKGQRSSEKKTEGTRIQKSK